MKLKHTYFLIAISSCCFGQSLFINNLSSLYLGEATTIYLKEDLYLNGDVTVNGNGSFCFNSTGTQKIINTNGSVLPGISVNKSSGELQLGNDLNVSNNITFIKGNIYTGSNVLTLGTSGSNCGNLSRTSGSVVGNIERWINTTIADYNFPVGSSVYYRPVIISFTTAPDQAGKIKINHIDASDGSDLTPSIVDEGIGITIDRRSNMYWILSFTTINNGTYNLKIYASGISNVNDYSKLALIHSDDGIAFNQIGLSHITSLITSDGTDFYVLQRDNITGGIGGQFYIGSNSSENPLPIELNSFDYKIKLNTVILNWQTATEVDNYGFEIERTWTSSLSYRQALGENSHAILSGAEGWEEIGFVQGNGNSNSPKNYTFTDNLIYTQTTSPVNLEYRLKQIDNDGTFSYSKEIKVFYKSIPKDFTFYQNYPNPFNPTTKIKFDLPVDCKVRVAIHNLLGEEIRELLNTTMRAGFNEVDFDANDLATGIYFYSIKTESLDQSNNSTFNVVKKMLLVK